MLQSYPANVCVLYCTVCTCTVHLTILPLQYGWTPLHHAARNGNVELCRLLVSHDCRPHLQNMVRGRGSGVVCEGRGVRYVSEVCEGRVCSKRC